MAGEVELCNRALDILGADTILSLDENTDNGRLCKRNFVLTKRAALASAPWKAATWRVALPALADAPAWGYTKWYQLPADLLRPLSIEDQPIENVDYKIEGDRLLIDDSAPLNLRYIREIGVDKMTPLLFEFVAAALAAVLAYKVTGSREGAAAFLQEARSKFDFATMIDAQADTPEEFTALDWLQSRF